MTEADPLGAPLFTGLPDRLTSDVGRVLSSSTKSPPFWPARSPRWILRCFSACNANVPVTGGVYQINRVPDPSLGATTRVGETLLDLPSQGLHAVHSRPEGTPIATSVARYTAPEEIPLETIQAIVRAQTRTQDLFSDTHDQLQAQINMTAEFMYETQENLVFNHPTHGLLNTVDPSMDLAVSGPPSPDVLDDLLALAWKRPDCFVMHPVALAEFRKQANARSLTLEEVEIFGASFTTWRGLPLCPTNKLQLVSSGGSPRRLGDGEGDGNWRPASHSPAAGTSTSPPAGLGPEGAGGARTNVLLLRLGADKQGVVSLHAADTKSDRGLPFMSVELMGLSDTSVASYLMTMHTAVAVLSPGALARARVVV